MNRFRRILAWLRPVPRGVYLRLVDEYDRCRADWKDQAERYQAEIKRVRSERDAARGDLAALRAAVGDDSDALARANARAEGAEADRQRWVDRATGAVATLSEIARLAGEFAAKPSVPNR